eukprot:SAG31_NODE_16299_length_714_cov_1.416260_1_plen_178_part_10
MYELIEMERAAKAEKAAKKAAKEAREAAALENGGDSRSNSDNSEDDDSDDDDDDDDDDEGDGDEAEEPDEPPVCAPKPKKRFAKKKKKSKSWNWWADVRSMYAAVGGLEKLRKERPSTGYFGNGNGPPPSSVVDSNGAVHDIVPSVTVMEGMRSLSDSREVDGSVRLRPFVGRNKTKN